MKAVLLSALILSQGPWAPAQPLPATASRPVQGPGLALRLQGVQRLGPDQIRGLQAELAMVEAPSRGYYEALAAYALVGMLRDREPQAMEALLERTLKALDLRRDAESLALQGACLGLKLGFHPAQGMTLAPRASDCFRRALEAAPGNPRALLFQGIHVMHTPVFFGGGARKALPILQAAVQAADREPAPSDPWVPSWGRAEGRAWLAMAQADAGLAGEARASLTEALALDPGYGFARFVVLPRLAGGGQ